jgi:hypothetical protein
MIEAAQSRPKGIAFWQYLYNGWLAGKICIACIVVIGRWSDTK